ncbi:MAG: hypothetical protein WCD43_02650 [Candidatus Acidiferrales bacterium]
MRFALPISILFIMVVANPTSAQTRRTIPLSDATDRALRKSQLTLPGSAPFHIKFSIRETTNPQSDRRAEVEEYWVSPEKYRRTIQSPAFSQTLIVNGDAVSETNTGDYYPYWLYRVVTAVFDPVPFAAELEQTKQEIAEPSGGANDRVCGDLHFRVDRIIVCFEGSGRLQSVFTKSGYAEYKDYQKFGDKQVARRVVTEPEYKSEIEAAVTALDHLPPSQDGWKDVTGESLFEVKTPTPASDRIQVLRIGEDAMRSLVIGSSDIAWPAVVGGQDSGGCGAFLSADRNGNIREEFPAGCDNPSLDEPLHEALLKWKLKKPVVNGVPVQVTALMGFPFKVHVEPAPPITELSDEAARKLAANRVEPVFPSGARRGTRVEVMISVDDDGTFVGAAPGSNKDSILFSAAYNAVARWKFSPYVEDGKPVPFKATLVFIVP